MAVVMMQDDRQWYPLPNGINHTEGATCDYFAPVTITNLKEAVALGLENVTLLPNLGW